MVEHQIDIATRDGRMPTFVVHPGREERERKQPCPVVLLLMDGLGIREALRDVARRLATMGYYVLLPDLYYRAGEIPPIEPERPGGWDRMMSLVQSLSDDMVIRDAEALLEYAAGDAAARSARADQPAEASPAGVMGFCMGGRFSVVVAQGLGPRIGAAVAIHPGNLASDAEESCHRHVDRISAELHLAIADQDHYCTPEQVSLMEKALVEQGVSFEIEWHRGAVHGFGVPGSDAYNEQAAERVWERIGSLFSRRLC